MFCVLYQATKKNLFRATVTLFLSVSLSNCIIYPSNYQNANEIVELSQSNQDNQKSTIRHNEQNIMQGQSETQADMQQEQAIIPSNLAIKNIYGLNEDQKHYLTTEIVKSMENQGVKLVAGMDAVKQAENNINQHYLTAEFDYAPGSNSAVLYHAWVIFDPLGNKLHAVKGDLILEELPKHTKDIILPNNLIKKITKNIAGKLSLWWIRYGAKNPQKTAPINNTPKTLPLQSKPIDTQNTSLNFNYQKQDRAIYNIPQNLPPTTNYYKIPSTPNRLIQGQATDKKYNQAITNSITPNMRNSGLRRYRGNTAQNVKVIFIADYAIGIESDMAKILMQNLKRNMRNNGFLLTDDYELSPLKISAVVKFTPLSEEIENIEIKWHLQNQNGDIIGIFHQQNEINREFMKNNWAKIVQGATYAATQKIVSVLNQ